MRHAFSFGPNSNPVKNRQLGDGRLFNAFVTPLEDPAKDGAQFSITTDPGLEEFSVPEATASYTRGLFSVGLSSLYSVVGEHLYKVSSIGVASLIGTVTGAKPVITSVNRAVPPQTVITADTQVYEMQADTLLTFQDPDLGGGVAGSTFFDGYTIILLRSGVFQWTGLNTLAIDPLSFAEAEARSDGGVLPYAFESKLWLAGTKTIEVWSNVGTSAALPFERDTVIERGVLSKFAFGEFDETLAFVDDFGRVCRMVGYSVQVFSNPAVEEDIRRTMDLQLTSAIEAFTWVTSGHQFYVVCGHDWTWVYDAPNKLWHAKDSFEQTKWRARGYLRFFDKHILGSHIAGKLYTMSHEIYDEDGDPLVKRLRSGIIGMVDKVVEFNQFDLDAALGVGINSSDINLSDPLVQLRWSDNGGKNWSMPRIERLGAIGEVGFGRIRFTRLGTCMSGRGRMFELIMSHPVQRIVLEAVVQLEQFDG